VILSVCDSRNDQWVNHVKIRIQGAVSDLHTADARYHEDCKSSFMALYSVKAAASGTQVNGHRGYSTPVCCIITNVKWAITNMKYSRCVWVFVSGGVLLTRRMLINSFYSKKEIMEATDVDECCCCCFFQALWEGAS